MLQRATLSAVAVAGALTLVAGCGASSSGGSNDSSAPPKTELTSALGALNSGSALTTTLSLDTTGADILKLASQGGDATGGPTPAQASLIAGAHLTIETVAPKGKTLGSKPGTGDAVAVTGGSGGTTYFSLRSLDHNFYLQVDLKGILAEAGESSEYQTLVARVASTPAFVQAFVAGKWVMLSTATITSIEALAQAGSHGAVPANSALLGLSHQLKTTLLSDVTVTRASTGTTDHLVATANIRKVAESVVASISAAIPAAASSLRSSNADTAPDKTVTADAFVTSGALSKISFNVDQFAPTKEPPFSVVASFVRSGAPISAPAGATPVAFAELLSLFETIDSSSSSGTGTAIPAPTASSK
jgi:hypothetical protein